MKFLLIKFLFLFYLIAIDIFPFTDSLLVKIGSEGISVDEFQQRFELVPQVINGIKRNIEQKKDDLLYSLIAEKLWARESETLKLDTSDIMQYTFLSLENMFVRDALYKIEITDKIEISDIERAEGLKRVYYNLQLDLLQYSDSATAFDVYSHLKLGEIFDSIKVEANQQIPTITVKYGEFKELIEDELYSLNENEFTSPIKSNTGWIIFKLRSKEQEQISSRNQAIMIVDEMIRKRKSDKYFDDFWNGFFADKKVETDGVIFWSLVDKISERLNWKKNVNSIADSENVSLDVSDIYFIEQQLGIDTLNMLLVKFEKSPATVKQFLRDLIFDGFSSANVKENTIAVKMNARVRLFIEHELLAHEGYRRGLQNLPEVKSSISMWRDNYLAKLLKNMLRDSIKVSNEEVQEYYQTKKSLNKNSTVEVNILEILTDSLEVIETVLRELENGADFRHLASLHTKRVWTKMNGGEFGFFPITMYGDLGKIASTLNIGEMYGPIYLPEGYSIFKLIDKKESKFDSTLSFEQSKDEIKKELTYEKSVKFFIDYTVKLANKFGVSIDEQLLNSIELLDMNLFVYRYMGFGGRITAVPLVIPFNEWFLPWKESKKLSP